MRIAVGADHAGTALNEVAIAELRRLGHEVVDLGTHDPSQPDDYPDYAAAVAEELTSGRCERGLLICGSGVGVAVAANKVPGIRAGMCHDFYSAHQAKERPDTLRHFLYAPKEDKVRRLLARGKNKKEAEELVDTVDGERADFIRKYFKAEWPDRGIYHGMINTVIGDESTVHLILHFVETYRAGAIA